MKGNHDPLRRMPEFIDPRQVMYPSQTDNTDSLWGQQPINSVREGPSETLLSENEPLASDNEALDTRNSSTLRFPEFRSNGSDGGFIPPIPDLQSPMASQHFEPEYLDPYMPIDFSHSLKPALSEDHQQQGHSSLTSTFPVSILETAQNADESSSTRPPTSHHLDPQGPFVSTTGLANTSEDHTSLDQIGAAKHPTQGELEFRVG